MPCRNVYVSRACATGYEIGHQHVAEQVAKRWTRTAGQLELRLISAVSVRELPLQQ